MLFRLKIFSPFVFLLILLSACSGKVNSPPLATKSAEDKSVFSSLATLRVKELFIVLFEKNFSEQEWQKIFEETNQISLNKKLLREIEGQSGDSAQALRADAIGKNSELLIDLGSKSLFMLSWSFGDENCKIAKDGVTLSCKPFSTDNPLNGGLPKSLDPLTWITPDPLVDDVKTPYLKMRLGLTGNDVYPSYAITLRLRPELLSPQEKWFKGDALPEAGSHFRKQDGTVSGTVFPYGYSEMTLGN